MAEEQPWQAATQRFLQASYPQRSRSQVALSQQSSPLKLRHSKSDSELDRRHPSLSLFKSQNIKQVQINKEDHTGRNIILVAFFIFLIIFGFDYRNEIERERHKLELQSKHCFQAYTENQCDNPVEAMQNKCKEYYICYTTPQEHKLKFLQIAVNLVGQATQKLMKSAGLLGTIFLLLIVFAVFYFAYKSSRQVTVLKQH